MVLNLKREFETSTYPLPLKKIKYFLLTPLVIENFKNNGEEVFVKTRIKTNTSL